MFDRCLYFNVNALARIVNKRWITAFKKYDLSPAHGYMLRAVLAHPGITQKLLADELQLEKSTITRFVDSLQQKKLVLRKKLSNGDAREQSIYPTEKAKRVCVALEELGESLYQSMVAKIGDDHLKLLVEQLRTSAKKIE